MQTPPTSSTPPARVRAWVPIRSLGPGQRPRILAHLLALTAADRYLRFGHPASDAQLAHYVEQIDFDRDEVFAVFNRRLELLAMAHLAYAKAADAPASEAEFGVSVAARARGRGYGARMFEHAVLHARNRGVDTMVIHALSENTAMMRIVRKAGATIERDGGEAEARLKLPPEDFASQLEQVVGDQAAEIDYRLKAGAKHVDGLLEFIAELRGGNASQ